MSMIMSSLTVVDLLGLVLDGAGDSEEGGVGLHVAGDLVLLLGRQDLEGRGEEEDLGPASGGHSLDGGQAGGDRVDGHVAQGAGELLVGTYGSTNKVSTFIRSQTCYSFIAMMMINHMRT